MIVGSLINLAISAWVLTKFMTEQSSWINRKVSVYIILQTCRLIQAISLLLFALCSLCLWSVDVVVDSTCRSILVELGAKGFIPKEGHGGLENGYVHDGLYGTYGAKREYDDRLNKLFRLTDGKQSGGYINRFISKRKKAGQRNDILDLMGSGFHVEQSEVDSVTGLRYGPIDPVPFGGGEPIPPEKIPPQILGDIFNPVTWDNLDKSMKERSIPSFSLVTLFPVGGWDTLPPRPSGQWNPTVDPDFHALRVSFIVRNVQSRLSPGGRFYFSVRTPATPGDLTQNLKLRQLATEIERTTPYRLILVPRIVDGVTYDLSGALLPR